MNVSQKRRLTDAITALCEVFRQTVSEVKIHAYAVGLADLTIEQIEIACARALAECKFMPVPAELRQLSGSMGFAERAVLAFEAVARSVARLGAGASPDFDDAAINATIRNLGGWPRVCAIDAEEFEKWFRKEFERVYVLLCNRGISAEAGARLVGESEQHNRLHGFLVGTTLRGREGEDIPFTATRIATGLPPHTDPRLLPDKREPHKALAAREKFLELKRAEA